jgi:hypothetical protein
MIKAFCFLDPMCDFYTKQTTELDLLLCTFCSAEHDKIDLLQNFSSSEAHDCSLEFNLSFSILPEI